uniref:Uncharacterized protein LOC100182837 n=1 Tax=Phallusia mammillata TaxID=59560 RepID=A0A6F9DHY6_9ASCI|nr:uncharacterized protein LOC100182837 [Phallusia mammillata]
MNFYPFLLLVCTICVQKIQSELSETEQERLRSLPGHMKPFGSTGPYFEVYAIEGFPSTTEFFNGFVAASLPLVMKNAAHISPAYTKWTNEYLLEKTVNDEKKVFVEGRKKEIRTGSAIEMTFKEFVQTYEKRDMYWVSEVPNPLLKDVVLPPPLQCDAILNDNNLHTNVMWMSSGGTKSVVHNDDVDNINCLYRGNKTLIFVSPFDTDEKWMDTVIDKKSGGYSGLDVDAVDFVKYPSLSKMRYGVVHMKAGDCLYIPWRWVHQVNSFGDNLAVNIWFNHKPLDFIDLTPERCGQHSDVTLDQVTFLGEPGYGEEEGEGPPEGEGEDAEETGEAEEETGEEVGENEAGNEEQEVMRHMLSLLLQDMKHKKVYYYDTLKKYLVEVALGKPKPAWNDKCEKIVSKSFVLLDHDENGKIEKKDFVLLQRKKALADVLKQANELINSLTTYVSYAEMEQDRELIKLVVHRGDVIHDYAQSVYGNLFEKIKLSERDEL